MTREKIIDMAAQAGVNEATWFYDDDVLEKFAALVAAHEREKVAAWMLRRSYATGHGDTVEDLLDELEWQVAEKEREACAKLAGPHLAGRIAAAIRARGET
jgi:2-oxo-4-hydroxy-4-carboxy--5-ureidoimidazoline (OHCU) decarboxylase